MKSYFVFRVLRIVPEGFRGSVSVSGVGTERHYT